MAFTVLIPARLASTRLPNKPLADIAGLPMIVRVARQAMLSQARSVVVATDSAAVHTVCTEHNIPCVLTRADHLSGSDRLAEACALLALPDDEIVVNVQGDEPLIAPDLINAVAHCLHAVPDAPMSTAAHAIDNDADLNNPNVVKVVLDARGRALYFSRAPIAWWRDGSQPGHARPDPRCIPLRHIGIYGYRAGFLQHFPALSPAPVEQTESLEQLRVLWHGYAIAVHTASTPPGAGVDTPEDLERVRQLLQAPAISSRSDVS
jgi:3-deoxy-manno-octulosonate cytidylyltransferase (CMP-KDO synthetase)